MNMAYTFWNLDHPVLTRWFLYAIGLGRLLSREQRTISSESNVLCAGLSYVLAFEQK